MAQGRVTPSDAAGAGWQGVKELRENKGIAAHDLPGRVGQFILNTEDRYSSEWIIAEDAPWFFDGVENRMYRVDLRQAPFRVLLGARYGLFKSDPLARAVVDFLEAYGLTYGVRRPARRFSYFDGDTLYLSGYDGTAWRLDGREIAREPNGRGALFLDDDGGEPCRPAEGPDRLLDLVDDLTYADATAGGLTARNQRNLFAIWLHAIAFADCFAAKPLLLIEGEKGAGKTLAVQRIQTALTGRSFPLIVSEKTEDDFGIQILREAPIALLDNVDANIPWLQNAIAAYATSGGWRRRKKYTDADQIDIRPSAFVAIASRNPATFRRDDVADRCLIVRLARRTVNTSAERLLTETRAARPQLFGEWMRRLNGVVAALRELPAATSVYRLADFERIARAVGRGALGLADAEVDALLVAAQSERDALTLEDDSLVDWLDAWLELDGNAGRPVTAGELYTELAALAASRGREFGYKSARGLAARLRNARSALASRFGVERRTSRTNAMAYVFVKADPA